MRKAYLRRQDTLHSDTKHNDTVPNGIQHNDIETMMQTKITIKVAALGKV
jgi:hypothetical protein